MSKPYQKYTNYYDTKANRDLVDYSKSQKFNIIRHFIPKTCKILDIGSGPGHWLHTFALNGYEVYGIDLAPKCVDLSKQRGYEAYLADITKETPFGESFFDVIMVNHLFEHLDFGDRGRVMMSAYKLLKQGGVLIAATPYNQNLEELIVVCPECSSKFNWAGHVASFGKGDLKKELESQGFKVIDEFVTMPLPIGSKLPKRLIIFLCIQLLKRGYDVGVWEITTIVRKV